MNVEILRKAFEISVVNVFSNFYKGYLIWQHAHFAFPPLRINLSSFLREAFCTWDK